MVYTLYMYMYLTICYSSFTDKLQEEKSTHEFDLAEMRSHIRQLEATIKSQEHQVINRSACTCTCTRVIYFTVGNLKGSNQKLLRAQFV